MSTDKWRIRRQLLIEKVEGIIYTPAYLNTITAKNVMEYMPFVTDDESNGTLWLFGIGAPTDGIGRNGDVYLDQTTCDLYEMTDGVWVFRVNIKGATGAAGLPTTTYAYAAKVANYTITEADYCIECTTGTFTITLPTAVGIVGKVYNVKNSGSGTITLDGNGSETIDGKTTQTISQYNNIVVMSNGANWIIL